MTTEDWDITAPDDAAQQAPQVGPKALREAYERQKAQAEELRKQLESLNSKVRAQEVQQKLSAAGVPDLAWELFPKDVEPTDDAVSEWVEKFGRLFQAPAQKPTAQKEEVTTTSTESVPASPPADIEQLQQIQQVTSGGQPGSSAGDLQAMLANPNLEREIPFEKFVEALRAAGAKV